MPAIVMQLNTHGQIVIPFPIRKKLNLNPGDFVSVVTINGNVVLKPVTLEPVKKS